MRSTLFIASINCPYELSLDLPIGEPSLVVYPLWPKILIHDFRLYTDVENYQKLFFFPAFWGSIFKLLNGNCVILSTNVFLFKDTWNRPYIGIVPCKIVFLLCKLIPGFCNGALPNGWISVAYRNRYLRRQFSDWGQSTHSIAIANVAWQWSSIYDMVENRILQWNLPHS